KTVAIKPDLVLAAVDDPGEHDPLIQGFITKSKVGTGARNSIAEVECPVGLAELEIVTGINPGGPSVEKRHVEPACALRDVDPKRCGKRAHSEVDSGRVTEVHLTVDAVEHESSPMVSRAPRWSVQQRPGDHIGSGIGGHGA